MTEIGCERESGESAVREVVATVPSVEGVPAPVHVARCPSVGTEDVPICAVSVTEPPSDTAPPPISPPPAVTVSEELVRSALATDAHVATPRASSERGNWLVQDVPVYSAVSPPAPVRTSAEVREEKVGADTKVEVSVEVARKREAETYPPVTIFRPTSRKPESVEVAVVEVAEKCDATASPATDSFSTRGASPRRSSRAPNWPWPRRNRSTTSRRSNTARWCRCRAGHWCCQNENLCRY